MTGEEKKERARKILEAFRASIPDEELQAIFSITGLVFTMAQSPNDPDFKGIVKRLTLELAKHGLVIEDVIK
ncbi:MAG: hypothetical protein AMXMBFR7_32790 [Planctomycetota bacterium]